jgi:hypothetical protein
VITRLHFISRRNALFVRQFHHKIVQIKIRQLSVQTLDLKIVEINVEILNFKVNCRDDISSLAVKCSRVEYVASIFTKVSFQESLKSQ